MVARCQRGDGEAFRQLFFRHRSEVARLVFRMVGPRAELEDIIQEVFLQVHRSLKDFRGQSKFTTWLHRVTVNVVLMHRRAAKSRPQLVSPQIEEVQADARLSPDEDVARLERMRAFRRLLEQLAEKKRTVFLLHELEGLSPAEIAKIVGAPVLTVRTRLFYARRELAEMLKHEPVLAPFAQAFERGDATGVGLGKTVGEAR
jgi:RNA polymerase sigma-70 factor, ECF subfamily